MFSFAYPKVLLLLLLVPVYGLLYAWARYARRRNLKKFGNPKILSALMPDVSPYKPPIKLAIEMAVLTFVIIAAARPWGGVKDIKTSKEGIEVVIAVDASNSMLASATDDPDGSQRMRTAKLMLEKLINRLDNDRVGLIVYAGGAYTLIPVTSDYVSAKMFLNSIDPSQFPNQGTDIAGAIGLAAKSFSEDGNIGKAIVLITDAEDLEDPEGVMASARAAASDKIQVNVIGVGSSTPVPVRVKGSYLIDPDTGGPVRTAINEQLAEEVAREGKGIYVNATAPGALNELDKQLGKLKKTSLDSSIYAVHDELFHIFVWLALAAIVLDILVLDRKIGWLDKITFFKKESEK